MDNNFTIERVRRFEQNYPPHAQFSAPRAQASLRIPAPAKFAENSAFEGKTIWGKTIKTIGPIVLPLMVWP